jgi:hypothetical protein
MKQYKTCFQKTQAVAWGESRGALSQPQQLGGPRGWSRSATAWQTNRAETLPGPVRTTPPDWGWSLGDCLVAGLDPGPRGQGASGVFAMVTHGVFAEGAMARIETSPIERLLVTDTVETPPMTFTPKIEVVSVAPLFGEAIRRIHGRESISVLFPT